MRGRVAVVTGASSGIGRATALALARRGARVMAIARREPELVRLTAETGGHYAVCDLTTAEGCARAIDETRRLLGPVEILVNNAGGSGDEGSILDTTDDTWRITIALNLDAPFRLSREAAVDMINQHWGRIVMVSSTAGEVGAPRLVAYSAAKAGVLGLMRAISQDLAPFSATCNAVLPGWVKTETSDRLAGMEARKRGIEPEQVWAERAATYEAGRLTTVDEVAETIAFLCSAESSGVSGQAVTVAVGGIW
jgi:NAD(P)-dependent dehydrogenase (short-subunit alcohol dehydrogenase family)